MTAKPAQPKRKNPVERTRAPTLPPARRSREALGLVAAAAEGRFRLQVCAACDAVQYPPRQICEHCLGEDLPWRDVAGGGLLLSLTTLHHSNDLYFKERLPWHLGLVQLDCGPSVVAHVTEGCKRGSRVQLHLKLDRGGRAAMMATPATGAPELEQDPELRETTCDPKHRRALVVNGKTATGLALARALLDAGAREIYLGDPEPYRANAAFNALCNLDNVSAFELDVTNSESVHELAARIGSRVEILVNNSYYLRPGGITDRKDINTPRSEMDVHYFGLLRLGKEFGPVMRSRGADGPYSACAWVNVLSIYALATHPQLGTWSSALAAATSLARCLRDELYQGGVRVMNVFPGPMEDEWQQLLPPPKLPQATLARAVIEGLRSGLEDIYPGAVAEELRERLRENPKEVERLGTL